MANSTQPLPEWLDDWGGLHSLDDGHPGSYDHEAVAATDGDAVTLTCQCGAWTGYAPCAEGDAEGLLAEWRDHVHAATGRLQADQVSRALAAAESANGDWVVDTLAAEVERLQRRNEDLKAGLLVADADKNRLREALDGAHFILWGEIALFEARAQAKRGRRLKKARHDSRVDETWEAFRDALDAAIAADIAADAGEAL